MMTHYAISTRQPVSQSEKTVIVFDAVIRSSNVYQLRPAVVKVELCFLLASQVLSKPVLYFDTTCSYLWCKVHSIYFNQCHHVVIFIVRQHRLKVEKTIGYIVRIRSSSVRVLLVAGRQCHPCGLLPGLQSLDCASRYTIGQSVSQTERNITANTRNAMPNFLLVTAW